MATLILDANGVLVSFRGTLPSSLFIPFSCTGINEDVFGSNSTLTDVTFPSTITTYGDGTLFSGCTTLTSITLGDTGVGAFSPSATPFASLQTGTAGIMVAPSSVYGYLTTTGQTPPGSWTVVPLGIPAILQGSVPDAIDNPSATSNEYNQSTVSWTVPNDNGQSITSYTVYAHGNGFTVVGSVVFIPSGTPTAGSTLSVVVPNLTNGETYSFTVMAVNAIGNSPGGDATYPAVTLNGTPPTVPDAPTQFVATSGENGQSTLSWTDPVSDGGSPIISYTITLYEGSTMLSYSTITSLPIITQIQQGLTNGHSYTFTLYATNSAGNGTSVTSNVATPSGNVQCFPAGTRITTASGSVRVEDVKAGDLVLTADRRQVPVRVYSTTVPVTTAATAPYFVPKGYGGLQADLRLSPLHAFQIKKGLWQIPKYAALSNKSIQQYAIGESVTYYHLECPNFFTDNLLVNGCVVESYGAQQARGLTTLYKYNSTLKGFTRASNVIVKKALKI